MSRPSSAARSPIGSPSTSRRTWSPRATRSTSSAPIYLRFQTTVRKDTHEQEALELDWGDGLGYHDRFELGPRYGAPMVVEGEEAEWRVGAMRYVLHAEIAEGGKAPLWVGEVHREGRFDDRLKIEVEITRELVDTIGKTLLSEQE